MTIAKGSIKIERIPGTNYVRLLEDFFFFSEILRRWSWIPKGFVYDEESIPILKGTNPEAGAIHDYLCRMDSNPIVCKKVAAAVYQEFQRYYDDWEAARYPGTAIGQVQKTLHTAWDWIRRQFKTSVVEVAPEYFHKHKVMATYREMAD